MKPHLSSHRSANVATQVGKLNYKGVFRLPDEARQVQWMLSPRLVMLITLGAIRGFCP